MKEIIDYSQESHKILIQSDEKRYDKNMMQNQTFFKYCKRLKQFTRVILEYAKT